MNEHFSDQNIETADAEMVIHNAIPQMRDLLMKYKRRSHALMQYPYFDENDQMTIVTFDGMALNTPGEEYQVLANNQMFAIRVAKTATDDYESRTFIDIKKENPHTKRFEKAETGDVTYLGKLLEQLDSDQIDSAYQELIAERKAKRAKKIGRLLGRR